MLMVSLDKEMWKQAVYGRINSGRCLHKVTNKREKQQGLMKIKYVSVNLCQTIYFIIFLCVSVCVCVAPSPPSLTHPPPSL